ncbi:MAG: lipocalin family protein [Myxococcota bacterium]|nr:lipocalin family protein [Myxococcota bacterium]MEC8382591.1 lipocalin family protein [Myxococcota bacterium]
MFTILLGFLACQSNEETAVMDSAVEDSEIEFFAPLGESNERVAQLVPERYLGLWYEIATVPAGQQARCTGTTATYSSIDVTTIGVRNQCYIDSLDGPLSSIDGTATPIDERYSHLLVSFGGSFTADYVVIEVDGSDGDDPYDFAVVSSFDNAILWILHRSPVMDELVYERIIEQLESRDIDTSRLVMTVQDVD